MIRILYNFLNDDATVTSSSEVAGLPDDNVVDDFVTKVWRTSTDTGEWIKFDLGSAKQITEVALFGHNLTDAATVTLEAHTSDSWGTPDHSEAIPVNSESMVLFLDKTYRWWRITFDDAANPDGYIEIGRICMGAYYEPSINITDNVQKSWNDPSFIEMSQGRQAHVIERSIYRVYAVNFSLIPRTQQTELETVFRSIGKTGYCVISLDSDTYPSDDSIYGLLTTNLSAALTALEYGDVSLTFEEKVR